MHRSQLQLESTGSGSPDLSRRSRHMSVTDMVADRAKSHSPIRGRRARSMVDCRDSPIIEGFAHHNSHHKTRRGLKEKFKDLPSPMKFHRRRAEKKLSGELANIQKKAPARRQSLERTFSMVNPKTFRDERIGGGTIESKALMLKHILSDPSGIKALQQVLNANENIRLALAIAHNDGEIAHALSTRTNDKGQTISPKERLQLLLEREGNHVCADCTNADPTWASSNIGVFLCVQCAGVHRSLGTHISTVLSCVLDEWDHNQVDVMESWGNELANECWEYHVPSKFRKPLAEDDRAYRETYIEAKYSSKKFAQKSRKPAQILHSTEDYHQEAEQVGMIKFIGIVHIFLIKGESLWNRNHKHKKAHEIYCTLRLGKQEVRSKKVKSQDLVWNEQLMLCWDGESEFQISVYSDDAFLGMAVVDLMQLLTMSGVPMDTSPPPVSLDISGSSLSSSFPQNEETNEHNLPESADSGEVTLLLDEIRDQDNGLYSPMITPKKSKGKKRLSTVFRMTPTQTNRKKLSEKEKKEKSEETAKASVQLRIQFTRLDS